MDAYLGVDSGMKNIVYYGIQKGLRQINWLGSHESNIGSYLTPLDPLPMVSEVDLSELEGDSFLADKYFDRNFPLIYTLKTRH